MSDPTWWIVQTDMGRVIFHGSDKERAERVATMHLREAEPLYPASVVTALQEEVTTAEARANAAEQRLKDAVKMLKPFAMVAGYNINAGTSESVMVNVDRCRAARAFIKEAGE